MTEQNRVIEPGQLAPDVTIRDQANALVALSSFWTQRPTVLVFVRHFG